MGGSGLTEESGFEGGHSSLALFTWYLPNDRCADQIDHQLNFWQDGARELWSMGGLACPRSGSGE